MNIHVSNLDVNVTTDQLINLFKQHGEVHLALTAPDEIRKKPLRIRLNEKERSLVDEAAEIKDCSGTSAWVRQEILRLARRVVETASDGQKL